MATFGRTARQEAIWVRLNVIRELYSPGDGLRDPDNSTLEDYTAEEIAVLQVEWDALIAEYAAIHTANDTLG